MSPEFSFPFSEQLLELAGHKSVAVFSTVLLAMTGPPRDGETVKAWEDRMDSAAAELVQALLLAVDARRSVITAAAEAEADQAVHQ